MTVRDAALDVMRRFGMTTIFGNPGSTEITFLTDLPSDFEFVLALHEGSVVGIASGYALARGVPSFVNLHTAPGLGNAVNAIANARDCRAPLVIVVGQQDRRQMAFEPFLTGRALERVAGEYPVWSSLPARPQDVPGAIARAYHEALAARGPALVVVPMGDWLEEADPLAVGAPARINHASAVAEADLAPLVALVDAASAPALVLGAGADTREGWDAVVALAERLSAPVWQEAFGSRAGFPQDHPLFAGHLPWMRARMQEKLASHDLLVAIGTGAFRAYLFDEPVALVAPGTRVAVITADAAEAHRSPCDVAVVGPVAAACSTLAGLVQPRGVRGEGSRRDPIHPRPDPPPPPEPGELLRAGHVLSALAQRLPADAVVVEETPSSRPELLERIPARAPLGFVSNANGGLGFGVSGATGLKLGLPDRPVLAVLGDGSTMYNIQTLWSAARYDVGVLLIVLRNGGYAIMDELARARGGRGAWPGFSEIDIAGIAGNLGCPAVRVATQDELVRTLDEVVPGLAARREPLLLEVTVAP
ncbi:MAG TPA: thiamine pyrophosphate-dependent enzyme [Solirubrobacteraceae bacterium]|nr:thiamine pyrophosphate-dependent enzyme [Solirubrobacteraceae bacterium]